MLDEVEIRRWSGDEAELQATAALYGTVFSEPPYLESASDAAASFTERVLRYSATKEDLRLVVARPQAGGEPVGLILGSGVDQRDWWWSTVTAQLPPSRREWWLARRCFAIAELSVARAARRTGTASRLLAEVLEDLPYELAVLTCDPRAASAVGFYRSQRWRTVEEDVQLGDGLPRLLLARAIDPSARLELV